MQEAEKLREKYDIDGANNTFVMWADEKPADDELYADDEPEEAPAGGVATSSNASGKAPAKVVYAVNDGSWHDDVYEVQYELSKMGKFYSYDLNVEAKDELRTLSYDVALLLFAKIRDETKEIADINAFIVKHANDLRFRLGLDDAKTILKEIEPETVEDTESEQDDAGDAHEAEQEPPDVDSNGNSIEY